MILVNLRMDAIGRQARESCKLQALDTKTKASMPFLLFHHGRGCRVSWCLVCGHDHDEEH
jgi:hypothetical protein